MLHRASLVSHDTDEVIDVRLDVSGEHVEMFVRETSVGRWSVELFIGEPEGNGFQLPVDGERWVVVPRDLPLFVADTVPRTPRMSRARFVNQHKQLARFASGVRRSSTRRVVLWHLMIAALSLGSFGFGVIIGRYRVDGSNLVTWLVVGFLVSASILLGRVVISGAFEHGRAASILPTPIETRPVDTVDRLLSTLRFQAVASPSSTADTPPAIPATDENDIAQEEMAPVDEGDDRAPDDGLIDDGVEADLPIEEPVPVVDNGRIRLPSEPSSERRPTGHTAAAAKRGDRVLVISIGDDEDDLTTIHGIGPAYAAVLGELGIHSYRQLASIDSGTLAELRSRLGPLARRIERDRWIESAAAAYRAKRNESRRDAVVR
jgi:predicted flap endonuclease-1-like 5' DNA nuclease